MDQLGRSYPAVVNATYSAFSTAEYSNPWSVINSISPRVNESLCFIVGTENNEFTYGKTALEDLPKPCHNAPRLPSLGMAVDVSYSVRPTSFTLFNVARHFAAFI